MNILDDLRTLKNNWDSYGAPKPNERSFVLAEQVLDVLRKASFLPDRIVPSGEGGVGIVFSRGRLYADFECFNDGELLIAMSDRTGNPIVKPVALDGIADAITRIRNFLTGK